MYLAEFYLFYFEGDKEKPNFLSLKLTRLDQLAVLWEFETKRNLRPLLMRYLRQHFNVEDKITNHCKQTLGCLTDKLMSGCG